MTILESSPLDDPKKPKQTTYLSRPATTPRKATLDDSHLNGEESAGRWSGAKYALQLVLRFAVPYNKIVDAYCTSEGTMTQITISQGLITLLNGLPGPVQLVDEAGRCLGHFLPQAELNSDECPHSPAELERMRQEPGGRSLNEIWQSLDVQ